MHTARNPSFSCNIVGMAESADVAARAQLSEPVVEAGPYSFAQLGEQTMRFDRHSGDSWVLRWNGSGKGSYEWWKTVDQAM